MAKAKHTDPDTAPGITSDAAPGDPRLANLPDRALLLDWGGTLMRVMPRWMGPQHGWTDEEPMPHAGRVLCALAASWRLALASNASESDEGPIRDALAPMGVGPLLAGVYTWRSAGAPKPWPPFWGHVLRDLGLPAHNVVMIGDDWTGDVWGATQAGMHGIWFDPPRNGNVREARTAPRVRTMRDFRELPALLAELGFAG